MPAAPLERLAPVVRLQQRSAGNRAALSLGQQSCAHVRQPGGTSSVLYSDRRAVQAIGRIDRGADQNEGSKGTLGTRSPSSTPSPPERHGAAPGHRRPQRSGVHALEQWMLALLAACAVAVCSSAGDLTPAAGMEPASAADLPGAGRAQHTQHAQLHAWAAELAGLTSDQLAVVEAHTAQHLAVTQQAQHSRADAPPACDSGTSGAAAGAQQPGAEPLAPPSEPASAEALAVAELRRQLEEHYQAALKQALSRAETAADKGPVRALSPVQAASQRLETASPGDEDGGNATQAELLAAASAPLWALKPVSLEWQVAWEALQAVPPPPAAGGERKALKPNALNHRCSELGCDDSVRCRFSHICEGPAACPAGAAGDALGCITGASERQQRVKEATQWAWQGYRAHAWGKDLLLPVSQDSEEWVSLGLTLVDSLDTLLLMNMTAEFEEAREWVAWEMVLTQDKLVNLFETTIRVLGGLQAAFHLTGGDRLFLYKALGLGMRLAVAFRSPSGIPWSDVNLGTHATAAPAWSQLSSLSEVATLAMEFSYLTRMTGRPEFEARALAVVEKLASVPGRTQGLAPIHVSPESGHFYGKTITLGARGDSYYEYLLKQWILSGKQNDTLLNEYTATMRAVRGRMLARSGSSDLLYVAELVDGAAVPKMDHLVCFLPGLLALGHLHGINTGSTGELDDLEVAEQLARTCYELYRRVPAGLAPEIAVFLPPGVPWPKEHSPDIGGGDFFVKPQDAHNLLRPEMLESLFVLWRATGDPKYRDWGWHIFRRASGARP